MAYDERLGERVRDTLGDRRDVEEKKMFGGLAFMVRGHMCVGVQDRDLMVSYEDEVQASHRTSAACAGASAVLILLALICGRHLRRLADRESGLASTGIGLSQGRVAAALRTATQQRDEAGR